MKYLIRLTFIILLFNNSLHAKDLYVKTYGSSEDPALLFLHGGPGYNSVGFELTTAQLLADKGFYVIVYDRRGEGRSEHLKSKFNFKEAIKDIEAIRKSNKLDELSLIGHSFGGILAIKYAEKHPDKVKNISLVGAPISLQESFKTIINSCEKIYTDKSDFGSLSYIKQLKKMDNTSLDYAVYCFAHAMQNGFYSTAIPTESASRLFNALKTDSVFIKYTSLMTQAAPQGFWTNENYTNLDLSASIQALITGGIKINGIYGKEDGLYSEQQIADLSKLIGAENVNYLTHCSHSVFIDQQEAFLNWMVTKMKL